MTIANSRWALVVLGLLGAQGAAYGVYRAVEQRRESAHDDAPFEAEAASGTAPDVLLVRHDGEQVQLSALRGRVVVLHFWATWCEPCSRELPGLLEFAEATASNRVTVLAVSLDDSWKQVETFLDGSVPTSVVRGVAGDERTRYGVGPLPQSFLIDSQGRLVSIARGARDWKSSKAYETVLALR